MWKCYLGATMEGGAGYETLVCRHARETVSHVIRHLFADCVVAVSEPDILSGPLLVRRTRPASQASQTLPELHRFSRSRCPHYVGH